jgi:hypothetical protein
LQVLYEEVIVFEHSQDADVQHDVGSTHCFLHSSLSLIMFNSQSAEKAAQRGECYQKQESPVPPAIKHIAGTDDEEVLQLALAEDKPVEQEHCWQEYQEFKRIEEHGFRGLFVLQNYTFFSILMSV